MLPQFIIVALAATMAAAQTSSVGAPAGAPSGIPQIPQCLKDCFLPAIKETNCTMAEGPSCLCNDEVFTASMKECVPTSCKDSPDVVKKAEEMAIKGCANLKDCFLPAIKETNCTMAEGPSCLCNDEEFKAAMKECVPTSCKDEPEVAKTAEEMAIKGCAKYTAVPSADAKASMW
ncbi:hypothetical protein BZA05DRAFT_443539 [Tricharina praecox]|uniref:uncharacterized protein n=1 Tax=Tricharina praecox TaxID=43433 RepID=UPI00221FDAF9|nr:uncharacterized protein BZA05DRAFT_443539 [Tricharina praecox]KAI5854899.1 hypothetical protein BZA05DRAFT_443539 [Tricharina praecox]